MISIFKYFRGLAVTWLKSWAQYPVTLYLLFGPKRVREKANYIATCHGGMLTGLKWSLLPYRYDEEAHPKLVLKPYPQWICNIHYILQLACCAFHVGEGLWWFSTVGKGIGADEAGRRALTWQKIFNFYYPGLALFSFPITMLYRLRAEELKPLFTCPFEMEEWCIAQGLKGYVRRYMLIVTTFTYATGFFLPLIYSTAVFYRPCLPFIAIWTVADDCPNWEAAGTNDVLAKLIAGAVEIYYWVFLPGFYLGIGWIAMVYPGAVATRRIEVIDRELKVGNLEAITGFREVQILGILTNKVWAFPLMQLILGAWLMAEVIALYTVIRLNGKIPTEMFILFILVAMDGIALIHVHFKLLAEPCLASAKLFEYRKQLERERGVDKWFRRYVASCGQYRLKMADGRFFDKTTALVVWQFVVDRLIMCLVMERSK